MRQNISLLAIFLIVFMGSSCKKDSEEEYCWQLMDALGNPINTVCNKTESEMQAAYPNPCTHYRLGTAYCWYIDGSIFVKDKTEDYINRYKQCYGNVNAVKVACDYCEKWYTRQKHTYKPNNTFFYSPIENKQYCGDTAQTLFQGREIILRETADSLVTVKFSNNGVF